ncbi:hypothetical protein WAF17_21270 [Bernardetia sp. ABR2-2B]|uniref:hypothetical protein n=1 Tax=Bernardetia sp. ABR2-2B TaxID=3127472 RepID=UPI0030CFEEB9
MKVTLILLLIFITFHSCTSVSNKNNAEQSNLEEVNNFDSLLKSDTLKYLKYSFVDYETYDKKYWDRIDTVFDTGSIILIQKGKSCREYICVATESITIDKKINRVTKFSNTGSGDLGRSVSYIYNEKKQLIQYIENSQNIENATIYNLGYDKKGQLKNVVLKELKDVHSSFRKFNF